MRHRRWGLRALVLGIVLSCAPSGLSRAQSLDATDPAEIGRAIAALSTPGDRAAATQLAARISAGLPAPLLGRALDALVANGTPPAQSALIALARHRRPAVRAHVARGLATSRSPAARRVLGEMLDDPDPEVRSVAAIALGQLGAQGVLDSVMLAAMRGVAEAAILFGQQAGAAEIARMLRRVDATTLEPMAAAIRILLTRDAVPRPTKLAIVRRMLELGGPFAEHLLREIGASAPENDPVRRAIDTGLAASATEET